MSQLLIIVFVGIVAIGAGLGYWVRRRDVGKKAAARDARRGIAIIGIVTLVGFGASRLFSGFGADVSGSVLFSLLLAASCLVFVAWFSWRKRQAGRVLVDLGRSTNHKMFVVLGFLFPGLNVIPLLETEGNLGAKDVSQLLASISVGVLFLLTGLSHAQIRERGLFYLDRFVKCMRVDSYAWEGDQGLTLTFQMQGRLSFFRHLSVSIPETHKDSVEDLLAQNLPGKHRT